ncbi:MAG: MgtC/SapB family protein [Bacteroidales bacterium]|nr:MgtC/SapB family protein [Bacteroidales bacterium]
MNQLLTLFTQPEINVITISSRLLLSLVLGLLIGIERQYRRQSAGLRTFVLICTGCTAAMLLSIWIPQNYPNLLNGDPGRIAAQILTGIGFLGAGAIIQSRGGVYGLTTAASIWMAAIIGMCVGAGMFLAAFLATLITLFALILLNRLEHRHTIAGEAKELMVEYKVLNPDIDALRATLEKESVFMFNITINKNLERSTCVVQLRIHINPMNTLEKVFEQLEKQPDVSRVALRML